MEACLRPLHPKQDWKEYREPLLYQYPTDQLPLIVFEKLVVDQYIPYHYIRLQHGESPSIERIESESRTSF
jgi:hypothetical protein